ncbi:helix-turn-helix domain-containing protein [Burkholderia sp. Bp8963]|uniref:GlxA family transcriptional regulator n=1 Tax=Burkholderia sp. Bp8963 TaxID=2184547 RepID=UPI000F5B04B3|nr:helix-turn-helix domain-containing protein [Burkholderia sp. Bp8963]RQS63616.1 helix-turn-helix domain-containing protein [Burkholderia sp. Bp8963]
MPQSNSGTREIAVIGFDGVQSLDVVGPMEVFAVANHHSGRAVMPYSVTLASHTRGEIATHAGLRLAGAVALEDLPDDIDTIVIAGGSEAALRQAATEEGVLPWLRARATRTRRIASVCTGAFVLAAGGFLDGRRATTHWNACSLLQALRPAIQVEPDAIFVAEPPFYTSAGVTAGIDLCLSFVEADCGSAVALAVARELVLFMRRPGGQSQFSAGLKIQANATPRLRALITSIIDDPTGDLSGPALAERAGMSERTLSRVFRKEAGCTPGHFVEAARVDRAKALLETSDWPLARIAERAGFGSLDSLHRAFLKHVGATPGFYRERFGS